MIAGGRVTGKETGPGGGMGAVDFRTADGQGGSAKYYSKSGGIGQAKTGFNLGESVDYVIAIKKQGSEQVAKASRGTADPAKMVGADIYYFRVTRVTNNKFKVASLTKDGSVSSKAKTEFVKEGEINLSKYVNPSSFLGTIFIAETKTKTFRDMIYKSIESDGNRIKQMVTQLVEIFFTSLDQAGASAKDYAVSGDPDKGSNTMTALDMADNSFASLKSSLEKTDNVDDQQIAENKEQMMEALDKLIEATIIEHTKDNSDEDKI